jgi:hypothetical protein
MKRTLSTLALIAASVVFANAQAGELYPLASQDNVGVAKTRAQVQEELRAAQAAHQIVIGEQNFGIDLIAVASTRNRAEVMAESNHRGLETAFYTRG